MINYVEKGGRLVILALKDKQKQDHCQIYTRTKKPYASRDLIFALRKLAV